MKTVWTAGLEEQRQREVEKAFYSSQYIRERLIEILQEKITIKRRATRGDDRYQDPSWAYFQADGIGYERAMEEIISLISSKKD
jgi:hypothetical protein